ncbi:MAG: TetR/AcrR family transcriptional regulator [Vulcanimicrobiaceae bacterium]
MFAHRELHRPATSPEETRQRILQATRELFAKKGRRGTTTREIAERAGVNEATLFRHFGNKEALSLACAQYFCGTVELQGLIATLSGNLEVDLRTIAQALIGRLESVRDLILMSLAEEDEDGTHVGDQAWRAPAAIHSVVTEYLTTWTERGELKGDPRVLARYFMGSIFAHVIGRKKMPLDELQLTQEQYLTFLVDAFLHGVRSKFEQ